MREVISSGVRTYIQDGPEYSPIVKLFHGFGQTVQSSWIPYLNFSKMTGLLPVMRNECTLLFPESKTRNWGFFSDEDKLFTTGLFEVYTESMSQFLGGLSDGGAMAQIVACKYSKDVKGLILHSSSFPRNLQTPSHKFPVLHITGEYDKLVDEEQDKITKFYKEHEVIRIHSLSRAGWRNGFVNHRWYPEVNSRILEFVHVFGN